MSYQRIEVLTGSERRRQYTEAEKERLVDAAFRTGVVVSEAARRLLGFTKACCIAGAVNGRRSRWERYRAMLRRRVSSG